MRWHNHKEYELHLIVASSGKVFVGDYVGNFGPNSLFLTGPHLPHNWISQVEEGEVVAKRDMLVNFTDEMLEAGHSVFSELRSFTPMLERSRYGIEFRCPSTIDQAGELMQRIADSRGATRLGYFLIMLEAAGAVRRLPAALRRHLGTAERRTPCRSHQHGGQLHLRALHA